MPDNRNRPGSALSKWEKLFRIQLATQGSYDADIEKAVADVRVQCTDSRQTPLEAFGDPRSYATALAAAMPTAERADYFDIRVRLTSLMAMTTGGAIAAINLAASGDVVSVTLGQILTAVVAAPAWVLLTSNLARPYRRDPMVPQRRAFDENNWRRLWVVLSLFAAAALLWITFDQELFRVTKWLPLVLGLPLLASSQVLARMSHRRT